MPGPFQIEKGDRVSPEAEILLTCARTRLTTAAAQKVEELLQSHLDWEFVLERAMNDGVAALLHHHLGNRGIPEVARHALRERALADVRWNLFLIAELHQLMDLFQSSGITAVPLKGVVLAATVYGDVTLREVADIDILLDQRQAQLARGLLLEAGYEPEYQLAEKQDEAYLRYHYAYVLVHPDTGIVVELHWSVTPRYFNFDFDVGDVVRRLRTVSIENRPVPAMDPEDLLLVLCLHGAKHCWDRLIWVTDVAELLASEPSMNWPRILERAERMGGRRLLFLGLLLASEALDAPLPEPVRRAVHAERGLRKPAAEWLAHLQNPPAYRSLPQKVKFHLQCRERWRDRVQYTIRLFTTSTIDDWNVVSLPHWLSFLYVLLRIPRLFRKYGPWEKSPSQDAKPL